MHTCPCGRVDARRQLLDWAACCARYLDHDTPAPDAESLMRSRYSAFVHEAGRWYHVDGDPL